MLLPQDLKLSKKESCVSSIFHVSTTYTWVSWRQFSTSLHRESDGEHSDRITLAWWLGWLPRAASNPLPDQSTFNGCKSTSFIQLPSLYGPWTDLELIALRCSGSLVSDRWWRVNWYYCHFCWLTEGSLKPRGNVWSQRKFGLSPRPRAWGPRDGVAGKSQIDGYWTM